MAVAARPANIVGVELGGNVVDADVMRHRAFRPAALARGQVRFVVAAGKGMRP